MQYTLKKPITRVSGDLLTVVTLREDHTLGDWLWIEGAIKADNNLERSAMALCRFGGLARAEIEQLSMLDYYALTGGADKKEIDAKKDANEQS